MEKVIKRENTAAMTGFRAMVMTALFAALGYVATRILQIPTPSGGYVNLGDTVVILGAYLLGPVYGGVTHCDEIGLPVSATGGVVPCGATAIWEEA